MLPEGWDCKNINEIGIQVIDGDRGKNYPKDNEFQATGSCLFLSAKNVTKAGFDFSLGQFITSEKHKILNKGAVELGDIVITTRGSIGHFAYYNQKKYQTIRINSGMAILRSNVNYINPDFLYEVCRSQIIKTQIEKASFGSAQPQLTIAIIKKFRIPPPLPEQKKIAAILSTWDRAIEGTEKLLANSQQQKKALMQQLLTGKKRLPGFTGEWKPHSLSELAVMSSGGTPLSTQKDYFGGNIPWVSIADMTRCGKYISQTEKTLTKSGLDNSSAKIYPKNTVLYAMYASIGECSIASTELSCSQAILGIRTNSKLYFEYLYFYLSFLKEKIKLLGQTGTQSNLNAKMVKAFRINLPPIPEQKAIAAVLSTADEEITAIESDLSRLRQEKKALMQQLLTGKRRVKVD